MRLLSSSASISLLSCHCLRFSFTPFLNQSNPVSNTFSGSFPLWEIIVFMLIVYNIRWSNLLASTIISLSGRLGHGGFSIKLNQINYYIACALKNMRIPLTLSYYIQCMFCSCTSPETYKPTLDHIKPVLIKLHWLPVE